MTTEISTGAERIAAERQRQISAEGYMPSHDAEHVRGELEAAALVYLTPERDRRWTDRGRGDTNPVPAGWPWHPSYFKSDPDDRVRELVKAGALIAAEIDRLTTFPSTGTEANR